MHALQLDPNLGEAHAALAFIRRAYDWDWVGADVSARRALELEPGNGAAILGVARVASYAYFLGRLDEAVASFTKVLELNPEYPAAHEDLAVVYLAVPELALEPAQQRYTCLEKSPTGGLYRFESLASGFQVDLPVDADGLVLDYPGVFRRVGAW